MSFFGSGRIVPIGLINLWNDQNRRGERREEALKALLVDYPVETPPSGNGTTVV